MNVMAVCMYECVHAGVFVSDGTCMYVCVCVHVRNLMDHNATACVYMAWSGHQKNHACVVLSYPLIFSCVFQVARDGESVPAREAAFVAMHGKGTAWGNAHSSVVCSRGAVHGSVFPSMGLSRG